MQVYIEDIGKHQGEEVTIKGWLHNRRSSGKIHFLILRDGTGFIQAVMSKAAVGDERFRAADHLSQETSIIVTGIPDCANTWAIPFPICPAPMTATRSVML